MRFANGNKGKIKFARRWIASIGVTILISASYASAFYDSYEHCEHTKRYQCGQLGQSQAIEDCLDQELPECAAYPLTVIGEQDGECEGYNWYPGCKDRLFTMYREMYGERMWKRIKPIQLKT